MQLILLVNKYIKAILVILYTRQLSNSPIDTELRDLRGAFHDLSHRLPSLPSTLPHNRPSAPQPSSSCPGTSSAGPPPKRLVLAQPGPASPTQYLPTRVPPPAPPMLPSYTEALVSSTKLQPRMPPSARLKARAPHVLGLQRQKSRLSCRPLLRRALLPFPALPDGSMPPADLMPPTLTKP